MTDGMRFWDERVVLGTEALRKSCTFSFRPFILSSGGLSRFRLESLSKRERKEGGQWM
jgi:hypothetical protein